MKTLIAILTGAIALAMLCQVAFGVMWVRSTTITMPDSAGWCEAFECASYR